MLMLLILSLDASAAASDVAAVVGDASHISEHTNSAMYQMNNHI